MRVKRSSHEGQLMDLTSPRRSLGCGRKGEEDEEEEGKGMKMQAGAWLNVLTVSTSPQLWLSVCPQPAQDWACQQPITDRALSAYVGRRMLCSVMGLSLKSSPGPGRYSLRHRAIVMILVKPSGSPKRNKTESKGHGLQDVFQCCFLAASLSMDPLTRTRKLTSLFRSLLPTGLSTPCPHPVRSPTSPLLKQSIVSPSHSWEHGEEGG